MKLNSLMWVVPYFCLSAVAGCSLAGTPGKGTNENFSTQRIKNFQKFGIRQLDAQTPPDSEEEAEGANYWEKKSHDERPTVQDLCENDDLMGGEISLEGRIQPKWPEDFRAILIEKLGDEEEFVFDAASEVVFCVPNSRPSELRGYIQPRPRSPHFRFEAGSSVNCPKKSDRCEFNVFSNHPITGADLPEPFHNAKNNFAKPENEFTETARYIFRTDLPEGEGDFKLRPTKLPSAKQEEVPLIQKVLGDIVANGPIDLSPDLELPDDDISGVSAQTRKPGEGGPPVEIAYTRAVGGDEVPTDDRNREIERPASYEGFFGDSAEDPAQNSRGREFVSAHQYDYLSPETIVREVPSIDQFFAAMCPHSAANFEFPFKAQMKSEAPDEELENLIAYVKESRKVNAFLFENYLRGKDALDPSTPAGRPLIEMLREQITSSYDAVIRICIPDLDGDVAFGALRLLRKVEGGFDTERPYVWFPFHELHLDRHAQTDLAGYDDGTEFVFSFEGIVRRRISKFEIDSQLHMILDKKKKGEPNDYANVLRFSGDLLITNGLGERSVRGDSPFLESRGTSVDGDSFHFPRLRELLFVDSYLKANGPGEEPVVQLLMEGGSPSPLKGAALINTHLLNDALVTQEEIANLRSEDDLSGFQKFIRAFHYGY